MSRRRSMKFIGIWSQEYDGSWVENSFYALGEGTHFFEILYLCTNNSFKVMFTAVFQSPPKWEAAGGLKFYWQGMARENKFWVRYRVWQGTSYFFGSSLEVWRNLQRKTSSRHKSLWWRKKYWRRKWRNNLDMYRLSCHTFENHYIAFISWGNSATIRLDYKWLSIINAYLRKRCWWATAN